MKTRILSLVRDPFVLLIFIVIAVPAGFVILGVQQQPKSAVNSAVREVSASESERADSVSTSSSASSIEAQPITQAEQPAPVVPKEVAPAPAVPAIPTCDQSKKQAAAKARDSKTANENRQYQRNKNRLRLITMITHRYMDEEEARHQSALQKINSDYQAALTAANCG